ncbi:MAG TPA: beta-ketoacyl synthase chain length factor [Rhodanobacteraceae bacterium]
MRTLTVYVDGIGIWAPGIEDWAALTRVLSAGDIVTPDSNAKPAPAILPPTERRRAPEPVLLASEAASQAATMAGRDPATLASVFTSTHGDLAITDTMCATLAIDPRELSPTRFHNSVHNAPAGYWTVAAHCHKTATAISAGPSSFAAGIVEAATEVIADGDAVLLAAYDIVARGPLAEVAPSGVPFAAAFVLSPSRSAASLAALSIYPLQGDAKPPALPDTVAAFAANPTAVQALPLLVALAQRSSAKVVLASGANASIAIEVAP